MRVIVEGKPYNVPDDATPDEIDEIVSMGSASAPAPAPAPTSAAPEMMEPPAPRQPTGPLQVAGEFANAANRSFLEGLDYVGPGAVNAGLRLAGSDYQMPTLTGMFEENVPGAQGGFMPEGTERDVVRGAGGVLPVAGAMVGAGPRNLAKIPEMAKEWFGFGTGTTTAAAGQVPDYVKTRTPVDIADQAGYPLTPGQRFDSKGLQLLESAIDSTPIPFNPMHRIARQQQNVVNKAAAESIGLPGQTRLTQENMGGVANQLSDEFERLKFEGDLTLTDDFGNTLADIEGSAGRRLFKDPVINDTIDKIMDWTGENGVLSAPDYQSMSSELKAKIRQSFKGDSPDPLFADSLGRIVSALDDLAENNMDGVALERLKAARKKWKTLSALEGSRAVKESGDVSGPLLANYLRRTDKGGYARGGNTSQLYDAARSSKAFPPRPDSGTAGRMLLQHPFITGAAGGGAALADPMYLATLLGLPAAGSALANAYMVGAPAAMRVGREVPEYLARPGILNAARGYLEEE